MIENGEFDVILKTPLEFLAVLEVGDPLIGASGKPIEGRAFYRDYYEKIDTFRLSLTERPGGGVQQIEIWRPKPGIRGRVKH
jgi:hypothetical protein